MSGEFIDEHESGGLGELPSDLMDQYSKAYIPPPGTAQDIASAHVGGIQGVNVPAYNLDVKSVYDARPINGTDFFSVVQDTTDPIYNPPTDNVLKYDVPNSYYAIIRKLEWEFGGGSAPGAPDFNRGLLRFSVQVNGIIAAQYESDNVADKNWAVGMIPAVGELDVFIICPPKSRIRVYFSVTSDDTPLYFNGSIYGNLLLDTGVAQNYIVGSAK
jgi:hypothetical protein